MSLCEADTGSSQEFTMTRADRLQARNVQIYDLKNPETILGGLYLAEAQQMATSSLYTMLDMLITVENPADNFNYFLQTKDGLKITRDNNIFKRGTYYLNATDPVHLTNEAPLLRTISLATGTRVKPFTDAVRSRDDGCLISGRLVEREDGRPYYDDFQAAHVFPLAYEGHWKDGDFRRWITQVPEKGGTINSIQNGLLLTCDVHSLFDTYALSINPDDGHKVVCFYPAAKRFASKAVSREFLDNPLCAVYELLRWHFRQAVLTNMKGAGEPTFEHDFGPGSDIMGEIRDGPKAAERMEYELFGRLARHMEIY